jgi:UDP-2,3-diacylglucosamine hydrolase
MKAIFLSDVHLRAEKDPRYGKLFSFLESIRGRVDHLFIAGDFFDFWFSSEKRVFPAFVPVIGLLAAVKESGVDIHFCEGNHDFYLEEFFTNRFGMEVFSDRADVVLDGKKIFLSHGDTIDRENKRYLFLRSLLRSRAFYLFQKAIPAAMRWKLAAFSSDLSKEVSEGSREKLLSKMEAFSELKFRQGYDAVVLGHCHKPILRRLSMNGRERVFVSLGDWIEHYSYLYVEDGEFRLEFFIS